MTKKTIYLLIGILLCSCQKELSSERIDGDLCLYMNCLIGNAGDKEIDIRAAYPLKSQGKASIMIEPSDICLTLNQSPLDLRRPESDLYGTGSIFTFDTEINPGDEIVVEAKKSGFPCVTAATRVPRPVKLISATVKNILSGYIEMEIIFEEDEEGHYGILFNDFEISEAPGIVSAESYDMIIPDSILGKSVQLWNRNKEKREGKKVTVRTYVDIDRINLPKSLDISILSLSPEAYGYLKGKYINRNINPATIGMATPTFSYSNVIGGIGVIGSWWATKGVLHNPFI